MKLQYCSDLHLEFPLNEQLMKKYPLQVTGDILLLAGDIVPFAVMDKHRYFFDFVSDNFVRTYWLPGNHEYYHADIANRSGGLNEQIGSNIFLVNNVAIKEGSTELIFSTMWSKINPTHSWEIERAMSDFHVIKDNGKRFSIDRFNQLHDESMAFIKGAIGSGDNSKRVVVTHHIPTYMQYPEKYKKDVVSEAFAVELFDLIEPSGLHSWIYGHHHVNTPDFMIGSAHMRTNQLGYVKYGENRLFAKDKVFEVV